jgi:hypothetical protein
MQESNYKNDHFFLQKFVNTRRNQWTHQKEDDCSKLGAEAMTKASFKTNFSA